MKVWALLLLCGLFDLSGSRRKEPTKMEEIQVDVPVAWEWLPLPTSQSALRVRRAVDRAGKPYDRSLPGGCTVAQLDRALRLDKTSLLVGEPMVVEMHVHTEAGCKWHEPVGGNYRGRGRDDNFLFLVQRSDGSWVNDPYGTETMLIGGGLSSTVEVEHGKPFSHWLAVQRWAAIEKPGRYELYAFQLAHDHEVIGLREALKAAIPPRLAGRAELEPDGYYLRDRVTQQRIAQMVPALRDQPVPSPLATKLPAAVRAALGERADGVADMTHGTLEIRAGTPAERAAMVSSWTRLAETRTERWPSSKGDAALEAIWFSRHEDFLGAVSGWMNKDDRGFRAGLAMNPSPRAADLLLASDSEASQYALHWLARPHIARAIPILIERLDHASDVVRSTSELQLHTWTRQRFGADWNGYRLGRPTRDEGARMKPAWRAWWQTNKGKI